MTDLRTLVETLKREVAVPGTYDDVFPDTDDDQLAATLADAFAQAQLDGYFGDVTLSVTSTPGAASTYETSRDLSAAGGAMLVLYAGLQILRAQVRTISQSATYKAGNVEYSTASMTTVIREEMKSLRERISQLTVDARRSGRVVHFSDGYAGKIVAYPRGALGGFYAYEFVS